jgi:homocysteine S-methyltransferase
MVSETLPTSHARQAFADRVERGPLLLDGALGTLLFSRGVPQRASLDELVLRRPELVSAVHREYIAAGADVIETDTFSANRVRLAPLGLADRTAAINRKAAQLAREAREVSGRDVLVAGSVGPISSPIHAPGRISDDEVAAAVSEQVEGLLEGGADLIMIETANDLGHLLAGVAAARRLSDLPILASMTFGEELTAVDGTTPERAAAVLHQAGVDALGVNCGAGPANSLEALEMMRASAGATPLLIMPNAGLPSRVGGEFVYAAGPDYFAEAVPQFIAAGARIIGGCCGTTPEHLAQMRQALDRERARTVGSSTAVRSTAEQPVGTKTSKARVTPAPRAAADEGAGTPTTRRHRPDSHAPSTRGSSSSASRSIRRAPSASSARCDRPRSSRTLARIS